MTRMLIDLARGRLSALPGSGRQVWSFSWVEDVAAGHLAAAERGRAGERYALGGENRSVADFLGAFAAIAGRRRPRWPVPGPFLRSLGALEELRGALARRSPRLTRAVASILAASWPLDSGPAERELGWRRTPLPEALRRTHEWLLGEGLAP